MIVHWKRILAFVSSEDELYIVDYARQMSAQTSRPFKLLFCDKVPAEITDDKMELVKAESLSELPQHLVQPGDLLIASWFNIKDTGKLKDFILQWPQPLLLLKQECNYEPFKHIILCSDFEDLESDEGLFILRDLAIANHSELRIIHVKASKDDDHNEMHLDEAERELHFFQPYLTCKVRTVYARHVYRGVKAYMQHKHNVDLVSVIRRRHNFLHELLIGNNTLELSKHIQEPVLFV